MKLFLISALLFSSSLTHASSCIALDEAQAAADAYVGATYGEDTYLRDVFETLAGELEWDERGGDYWAWFRHDDQNALCQFTLTVSCEGVVQTSQGCHQED